MTPSEIRNREGKLFAALQRVATQRDRVNRLKAQRLPCAGAEVMLGAMTIHALEVATNTRTAFKKSPSVRQRRGRSTRIDQLSGSRVEGSC